MSNYLTKLRQKPKAARNNIALMAASLTTLPILLYMVFGVHGSKPAVIAEVAEPERNKPFATFWGELKEQLASVQSAVGTSTGSVEPTPTPESPVVVVPQAAIMIATTSPAATTTKMEPRLDAVVY